MLLFLLQIQKFLAIIHRFNMIKSLINFFYLIQAQMGLLLKYLNRG